MSQWSYFDTEADSLAVSIYGKTCNGNHYKVADSADSHDLDSSDWDYLGSFDCLYSPGCEYLDNFGYGYLGNYECDCLYNSGSYSGKDQNSEKCCISEYFEEE